MSSTRFSQQPLQIFQDPDTSYDRAPLSTDRNSNNKGSTLRKIKNASPRRNIVFNPPQQILHNKKSPNKSTQQLTSSPSRPPFSSKLNMVSMPPPPVSHSFNTDSMKKKQPLSSKFRPQKALFTTFTSNTSTEKENYIEPHQHQTPIATYSDSLSGTNFSLEGLFPKNAMAPKRLLDAAPIHESKLCKKTKVGYEIGVETMESVELPAHDSFPPLHDDGTKPPHSYAQLIGMSILRAPTRRLTLAQIYKWISDTYKFYNATDAGWQNSIRHNLSLNKAFIKQERPRDDPGKGNYWAIQPGMEHQFIKDKSTLRKTAGLNENVSILINNLVPIGQEEPGHMKDLAPVLEPSAQPRHALPEAKQEHVPEISSDATIPNSDAAVTDLGPEEYQIPEPSSPLICSSPPMPTMRSSPPVLHQASKDTPPPVPRFPSSSRTRSHKRKVASMDDSGYLSSLESSAMRAGPRPLYSDPDPPRMKRGRAEEEIARLRGSSYESPTKSCISFHRPSSPVRRSLKVGSSLILPPATPSLKLNAPAPPPPSVSPNTNLRLHRDRVREMVGSPLRGMTTLDDNLPWSPAFNLDDTSYLFNHDIHTDFDIFNDASGHLDAASNGSPEKRSAKRPRVDRSRSANILADISNTSSRLFSPSGKSVTSTSLLKFTTSLGTSALESPIKGPGPSPYRNTNSFPDSPTKSEKYSTPAFTANAFDLPQEEFLGAEFLSDDVSEGWDIMQGFQKIGSGSVNRSPSRTLKSNRPNPGRSVTSRF